jgi:hypothetical protein
MLGGAPHPTGDDGARGEMHAPKVYVIISPHRGADRP